MRIDSGFPTQNTAELERTQKKPPIREAQTSELRETTLSSDVVELRSLEMKAVAGPEIREARVAELKKAVDSGTYAVADVNIAEAILRDALRR